MSRAMVHGLVALLLLAGCASPSPAAQQEGLACIHPWPCADGSEWPVELVGPFNISSIERVQVESHDGTMLNGWVALPDTPAGVKLPAVLHSTPYVGQNNDPPTVDDFWADDSMGPPRWHYIERGYAVVTFQVRGTGSSGGCLGYFGLDEQLDQVLLVNWTAEQTWSNGRVGMVGLSYHGTTPIEAAIHAPPALKTIVVAGIVTDLYVGFHTPQGALRHLSAEQALFGVYTGPPGLDAADDGELGPWSGVASERACPEVVRTFGEGTRGAFADDRNGAFWAERRLLDGVPNVTAAVLMAHGFRDDRLHGFQDDPFWEALPATTPRSFYMGQWSHEWPMTNDVVPGWIVDDWEERQFACLDHWLKGVGAPPEALGTIRYQDDGGEWHVSRAWPPVEGEARALYLAGDTLALAPASESSTFLDAPDPTGSEAADETIGVTSGETPGPVCPDALDRHLFFASKPVEQDTVIAGRAFAALTIRSSEPGGVVHATLLDLAPDFACDPRGVPTGARWVSMGTADLRFHQGNYEATPFPTNTPTYLRIDVLDLATLLPAGHRLALVLSNGDPTWARHLESELGVDVFPGDSTHPRPSLRRETLYQPMITVEPESHLILPLVEGELGALPPLAMYPARPFTV